MEYWDLSCRDWDARLRRGSSLLPRLPLDEEEAEMAVSIYNELQLPDVPGKPFLREASGSWFVDIVRALFGSWDPVTQTRFIEEVLCLVPKKNSKTTYGAALMIVALLMNRRPRAEFLFVGPTQAISDLAFQQADGMIRENSELAKRFHVKDHIKEIGDRVNKSKLKVKTFSLEILTGPRPAGVLLDEVHILGKHHDAARVLRQLRGGRQATPEGFLVMLTTQSDEPPAGVFLEELATARAVRDGVIQDSRLLPMLYEFPPGIAKHQEQWSAVENWPMVMPNLGRSLSLDRLQHDFNIEKTKGEAAVRLWASQHLNIEIGTGLGFNFWVGAPFWAPRGDDALTLDELLARSEICIVGIDGGGLDDLLALAVCGRDTLTHEWLLWVHAWAHPVVLERRKDIAATLHDFETEGDLTIVEQIGDDINEVVEICEAVDEAGLLHEVALDPVGIGAIVDALGEVGIGGDDDEADHPRVVGVQQGWKLSGALKTMERKLADGSLTHAGQRIMAWAIGNARVVPSGNAVIVSKQASGSAKIDPFMATLDAVARMSANPQVRRRADINDFLKNAVVA